LLKKVIVKIINCIVEKLQRSTYKFVQVFMQQWILLHLLV
jgi:hypothetical protein